MAGGSVAGRGLPTLRSRRRPSSACRLVRRNAARHGQYRSGAAQSRSLRRHRHLGRGLSGGRLRRRGARVRHAALARSTSRRPITPICSTSAGTGQQARRRRPGWMRCWAGEAALNSVRQSRSARCAGLRDHFRNRSRFDSDFPQLTGRGGNRAAEEEARLRGRPAADERRAGRAQDALASGSSARRSGRKPVARMTASKRSAGDCLKTTPSAGSSRRRREP